MTSTPWLCILLAFIASECQAARASRTPARVCNARAAVAARTIKLSASCTCSPAHNRYILYEAEDNGLELPYACRLGVCTACAVKVRSMFTSVLWQCHEWLQFCTWTLYVTDPKFVCLGTSHPWAGAHPLSYLDFVQLFVKLPTVFLPWQVKEGEVYQPEALGISQELKNQGYALMCVGYPSSGEHGEMQQMQVLSIHGPPARTECLMPAARST